MTISALDAIVLMLAVWRVSYLLVYEDAPFKIMARLRAYTMLGGLLTCIYCVSIWVAVAVLIAWVYVPMLVYVLAISGGALMMHRYTGG